MIREYRNKKGYTQEELAELLDISTRQIQRIENNESIPKMSTFKKIINILDISDSDVAKYIKELKTKDKEI